MCCTHTSQYLRNKSRGLPAFRRLLGKPILQDLLLQDVVFAGGAGDSINGLEAADRAFAQKLSELTKEEKKAEKQDIQAVRKGCGVRVRCPKRTKVF